MCFRCPSNAASFVGFICLFWAGIRILILFCIYAWLETLKLYVQDSPLVIYLYEILVSRDGAKLDNIFEDMNRLLFILMGLMLIETLMSIILVFAVKQQSYLIMLPWLLYSFILLCVIAYMNVDFYLFLKSKKELEFRKFVSFLAYYAMQWIFVYVVFQNFNDLRRGRTIRSKKENSIESQLKYVVQMLSSLHFADEMEKQKAKVAIHAVSLNDLTCENTISAEFIKSKSRSLSVDNVIGS